MVCILCSSRRKYRRAGQRKSNARLDSNGESSHGTCYRTAAPLQSRSLCVPLHQTPGDHIVQRLFFFRDARQDAINQEIESADRRDIRDSTAGEEASARSSKAQRRSRQIGHVQPQRFFAQCRLPRRAFQKTPVQPGADQA